MIYLIDIDLPASVVGLQMSHSESITLFKDVVEVAVVDVPLLFADLPDTAGATGAADKKKILKNIFYCYRENTIVIHVMQF